MRRLTETETSVDADAVSSPSRRRILQLLVAGVAGGALIPRLAAAAREGGDRPHDENVGDDRRRIGRIGLQLYTVRRALAKDVEGTIAAIAAAGITELEFAGYYEKDAAWWKALLKRHGLSAPSAHMPLPSTDEGWKAQFDMANAMGHRWVIMPYLDASQRKTADDWKRLSARLNTAAGMAKASGLKFGYHNHDFEFAALDGTTGYDIITSQTDASMVKLELDLYWAVKAGQDPLALMARMPGRVTCCHVKDAGPAPLRAIMDVGAGTIDFKTILAKGRTMGLEHWFIEHDEPKDPLASIAASAKAMMAF